jgi:hypothetical protein
MNKYIVLNFLFFVSCSVNKPTESENLIKKSDIGQNKTAISKETLQEAKSDNIVATLESPKINCFSKEMYEANQRDCSKVINNWVCGCNSISYVNECEAKKAGLKSFKKGKCAKEAVGI